MVRKGYRSRRGPSGPSGPYAPFGRHERNRDVSARRSGARDQPDRELDVHRSAIDSQLRTTAQLPDFGTSLPASRSCRVRTATRLINGQKGINNNVSTTEPTQHPFFGEQRGGQRPPFTVNLGRREGSPVVSMERLRNSAAAPALHQRRDQVGPNETHGTAHMFQNGPADARQSDAGASAVFAGAVGGRSRTHQEDKLFYFVAYDSRFSGRRSRAIRGGSIRCW